MLTHLQLVAYSTRRGASTLAQIALTAELQEAMQIEWSRQLRAFSAGGREVAFDAGYKPETDERFVINGFELPAEIEARRESLNTLPVFRVGDNALRHLSAVFGYARAGKDEVIMMQRFTRSHVIAPGRFLFMERDTFRANRSPGLVLANKPDVVYYPAKRKLLFANFRNANGLLPLGDFYREASEAEIRDILGHARLRAEDVEDLAVNASQWFRTRFSLLRDSRVLDVYTPSQIRTHAAGYLDIKVERNGRAERIVFPREKLAAKRLLQFLNEELYRGAITKTVYETNSKRAAD